MPRTARLDLPGLMQHVMVRGMERKEIFADDTDREAFCARLSSPLEETGTECLAWALIPNHFHLLLRPHQVSLASFMCRLLTGYAVTFNLRHSRCGRLYQNRYKSIVCEEEEYLLELVRYIHLNPIRAGLVPGLESLGGFAWSGHSVVMGRRELAGQAVEEVLVRFGRAVGEARRRYEAFVGAGLRQGRREEFSGGGLRRSLAFLGSTERRESYDARILGTGEFVDHLCREETLGDRVLPAVSLRDLIERAATLYGLSGERVLTRSTRREVSEARWLVCHVAVSHLGARGSQVGPVLGLGLSGVSRAVARGREIALRRPDVVGSLLKTGPE